MGVSLESVKDIEAGAKVKKSLKPVVVTSFDNSPGDVLKYVREGRKLYFGDGDSFLELPSEAYKALPQEDKVRYDMAKRITLGDDVIQTVDDGIKGFELPFEVRPESAGSQLVVYGRKPGFDYHWARPDKIQKHIQNGWVVDHDESTSTKYDESCTYKTVGGQKRPEAVLMRRPKELTQKEKAKSKSRRDGNVAQTQESFRESASNLGVKSLVDSTNG